MVEWIKVEDQLPELELPVWLWGPEDGIWIGARTDDGEGWLWGTCYGSQYHDDGWKASDIEVEDYHPTHWMLLPNLPSLQDVKIGDNQ